MPKSKAELIVELRESMKGTPYRMPLTTMKLHELETATATLAKMKADHATAAASIPVVSSGRPVSRPVAPAVADGDDDVVGMNEAWGLMYPHPTRASSTA